MSATTVAPVPLPAAASHMADPPGGPVRLALARAEGRRFVRHPLFVLGMAVSVLLGLAGGVDDGDLFGLAGGNFLFVGAGIWTFIVACLATSRARRDDAEDLYRATPATPRLRTQAALLSVAWPGLAGVVMTALTVVPIAGTDLAVVINDERYGLRPLELLQGPAYLLFAGALGVAIGSWTRRVYPALVGAFVLFMPPAAWLPWFVFGDDAPRGEWNGNWLGGASVPWHLVGFAGLIAIAAATALARHDRRPRVGVLALVALAAAIAGIVLGWPDAT